MIAKVHRTGCFEVAADFRQASMASRLSRWISEACTNAFQASGLS